MNVLVVVEQLRRAVPGGIGTYARGLLQGLAAMDAFDRPRLALHASRAPSQPDPLASIAPVIAARLPGPLLTRAWDRGWLRPPRSAADVVHATSLAFPPTPSALPLTVMVHDLAWRDVPDAFPPRGRRWHEAALGRALKRAAAIVVPSDDVAARVDHDNVHVIAEGCDHLPAPDHAAARVLLAQHGVDVDGGYLLTVSTLEPRKNLRALLDAHARARLPWPLVVAGARGWGDAVAAPAEGVVFVGHVDDAVLAALYASARCFVYVPLTEGFGLPPVEAMHAGTPVVSTPMPSVGSAALVVDDPHDVDAIASAVAAASTDEAERQRLVAAGRARAAELTWEAAARAHVRVWQEVAER